jgi:hypothetical protein
MRLELTVAGPTFVLSGRSRRALRQPVAMQGCSVPILGNCSTPFGGRLSSLGGNHYHHLILAFSPASGKLKVVAQSLFLSVVSQAIRTK